ncbi:MAG: hypothetical protein J0H08_16145 [Rhizobiales bacterium]|nr:hypothetical protein [Hyphomicrobiales bacterium]
MKRTLVAAALLLGTAMGAGAQDSAPDFTGTWIGDFDVVAMGRSADAKGEVRKVKVTYVLQHQEGRLIWGTVAADDGPGRPIVLAFSLNNGTLIGSDTEGLHRITIIAPTRLESCFTDNGSGAIVATCGIVTKSE